MEHKIELIGKYKSSSRKPRFYIESANVNNKSVSAPKMDYTKQEFMGLISPIWERVIMRGHRVKIVLICQENGVQGI